MGVSTERATPGTRMADFSGLLVGVIAGVFGMAYFVYGKRQTKLVPMVAGVLLCIFPFSPTA